MPATNSAIPRPRRWARLALLISAAVAIVAPLAASTGTASATQSLIVRTDNGFVQGVKVDDVRQFRGIQFAAPPVGDNRWRPPQPAASWDGVRDASQFGEHCAQAGSAFGGASLNEDCLFLNVYLPRFAIAGLPIAPVMVWIHGGALSAGSSEVYDPVALVERGVVVVTINYRLGALGFLAHRSFAAESPQGAAGNYGLLDQQAALKWVEGNIRHFGGNPRNVTIFGESAGGLSVHSHLASPLAAGLFDKAIVESGAYQLNQAPLATAETTADAFATRSGCTDQTAACLRALPVQTLLTNSNATIAAPTVDGYVLTTSVGAAFTSGNFNQVPIIEGSKHDEWRLFVAQTEAATHVPLSAAAYPANLAGFGAVQVPPIPAATMLANYPLANYPSPAIGVSTVGTDSIFACNSRRAANALSQFVKVYQYEFNDPDAPMRFFPPVSFPTGAYHAAEIQYLFQTPTPPANIPIAPFTEDQQQLSRTMVRYWTNFAWFGNPNFFGTPFWPRFDADLQHQALIPGTSETRTDFATDHKCSLYGV